MSMLMWYNTGTNGGRPMSITRVGIVGNGVVGSATGKAFAKRGIEVRYWDEQPGRITHNLTEVLQTGLVFVCLPTPSYPDGSCDVSVLDQFFTNGTLMGEREDYTFVLRSTVPVGYTRMLHEKYGYTSVYHWPEFANAKTAEQDMDKPRCVILGKACGWKAGDDQALQEMLWRAFFNTGTFNNLCCSSDESEAIKLFVNSCLAVKNAVFNEFRRFADAKGLDWDAVVRGVLADERVTPVHTQVPGPDGKRGFGGACLPKDLSSLWRQMMNAGVAPNTLLAASLTNEQVRPKESQ